MLPLTDLSDEITQVPFPDPAVLTGGTSLSPVNVTLMPCGLEPVVIAQPTAMTSEQELSKMAQISAAVDSCFLL